MTTQAAEATQTPTNGGGQALAVSYQAMAPMGSKRNLQGLLTAQMPALQAVLPRHLTPERLIKTLMVATNRTPQILECTQESVLECVMRSAELGVDLSGTLGEGYIVPFKNKGRMQATFIIGYRGLAKLARQSGEIKRIEAEVVYENDHFAYRKGVEFVLEFQPHFGDDRGKVLGVYALVEFKDGGVQADFMTRGDVEKVRRSSRSGNSPAWRDWWDEMAKKTVFRRLAKWLPLSGEKWSQALDVSNEEFDLSQSLDVIEVEPHGSKAESLAARLSADTEDQVEDQEEEPSSKPLAAAKVKKIEARVSKSDHFPADVYAEIHEEFGVSLKDFPADRETELLRFLEGKGIK